MHIETVATDPLTWLVDRLQGERPSGPRRVVALVPAERHAHVVRRRLCVEADHPEHLAGVLFLHPAEFARTLLLHAGVVRSPGWEDVRLVRLRQLFEAGTLDGRLRYFRADQLRSGRGYADAFGRTILDLEGSGLDAAHAAVLASQLRSRDATAGDRVHDVSVVWQAADTDCGMRRTASAILCEAAALLAVHPALLDPFGDTFAVLTHAPTTALLRFLHAVPACRVVLSAARPLRTGTQRWRRGVGLPPSLALDAAGSALNGAIGPSAELDLVRRFVFQVPEILARVERPRSAGADGTVDLEAHASLEEEIEAAVEWVAEQVVAGTPLEDIALIVPDVRPYAATVIDRLARLDGIPAGRRPPVYVAGGLPLADTAAGRRVLAIVHAVAHGLEAGATIRLLPALCRGAGQGGGRERLSLARAAELVYGAGIVGGSPGDPVGVMQWVPRLQARRDEMRALVPVVPAAERRRAAAAAVPRAAVRGRHDAERWLRDVEPILPALAALQNLAAEVVHGAPLPRVWASLAEVCRRWVWVPPDPPNLLALLDAAVRPLVDDPSTRAVCGTAALDVVRETVRRVHTPVGRFGEPAVFLGTAADAAGLSFAAVRILGLAEGALPHTPHDDPILPDEARRDLEGAAVAAGGTDVVVPRMADRVLDETHDVFRVIAGTRRRLAFSAPRQWADRSEREVSGLLLEVATALGRPAAGAGDDGDVPTAARLRAGYLVPGRAVRQRAADRWPITPRARVRTTRALAAAPAVVAVPAGWTGDGVVAVDAVMACGASRERRTLGALDGVVTEVWSHLPTPGFTARRPLSATGLNLLLGCPHRFLLERVLFLREPPVPPPTDMIAPVTYGALFHAAAEQCFLEMGPAVCRRSGALADWVARARAIAAAQFEARCREYPMRGTDSVARERARLQDQIEQLVRAEWAMAPREFLASELVFGDPDAVRLDVGDDALHVRGAVDRVDRDDRYGLSVRDLKTGRVRDFGEEPVSPGRDLQLGLYVVALEAVGYGGVPAGHAAYVSPSAAHDAARAFAGADLDMLRRRTREWLRVAAGLLRLGAFPRTPNAEDCTRCPFLPACGEDAHGRSARKLDADATDAAIAAFVRLKRQRLDQDDS